MSTDSLRWRDRVVIAQHSVTVGAIVLARMLDGAQPTERDWRDLTTALHRLQALGDMPS